MEMDVGNGNAIVWMQKSASLMVPLLPYCLLSVTVCMFAMWKKSTLNVQAMLVFDCKLRMSY